MLPEFVTIVAESQGLRHNRPLDRRADQGLEGRRVFKRVPEGSYGTWQRCVVGWLTVFFACITHCLPCTYVNRIYSPIYNQYSTQYKYIVVYSISAYKFIDLSFYSYSVPLLVPPWLATDRLKCPHYCFLFEKRPGVAKVWFPFYFFTTLFSTFDHGHRKALATETFLSH